VKTHSLSFPALVLAVAAMGAAADLRPARAQTPTCRERCETERKGRETKLKRCLEDVEPTPRDRAAKMRILCHQRYGPISCDGLPSCGGDRGGEREKTASLSAKPIVFSTEKRGTALARVVFAPGAMLHFRIEVTVQPRKATPRIRLAMEFRLLSTADPQKPREVVRFDNYFEDQKLIDPPERGLSMQFTLHGGAQLPPDFDPGPYAVEATVRERELSLEQVVKAAFTVAAAGAPKGKGSGR
jgi:hypothetical protein